MFSNSRSSGRLAVLFMAVVVTLGLGMGTAHAQTDPYVADSGQDRGGVADGVLDNDVVVLGNPPVQSDAGVPSSSTLPLTGGEVIVLAAVGGGLILLGASTLVIARRREASV